MLPASSMMTLSAVASASMACLVDRTGLWFSLHEPRPDERLGLRSADPRRLVLADLTALRQVRVEVILAVEDRAQVDPGLQAEHGADRLRDAGLVDDRQHARHRRVDQRDVAVGIAAELRRGPGKQLR